MEEVVKKKGGRPKGSKNRQKAKRKYVRKSPLVQAAISDINNLNLIKKLDKKIEELEDSILLKKMKEENTFMKKQEVVSDPVSLEDANVRVQALAIAHQHAVALGVFKGYNYYENNKGTHKKDLDVLEGFAETFLEFVYKISKKEGGE